MNDLSEMMKNTLCESLGMSIVEADPESIAITMPVDHRTHQPFGLLHGGASVALAETVASFGAGLNIDLTRQAAVGLEINANHIKSVHSGMVKAIGKPIHRGRRTQVWQIRIEDEAGDLVCLSRCTIAIIERRDS